MRNGEINEEKKRDSQDSVKRHLEDPQNLLLFELLI